MVAHWVSSEIPEPILSTGIGVFYQATKNNFKPVTEAGYTKIQEEESFGIYFEAPLKEDRNFTLKANIRVGVVNKVNFGIHPRLMVEKQVGRIQLIGGLGVKSFRPTGTLGFSYKFPNKDTSI